MKYPEFPSGTQTTIGMLGEHTLLVKCPFCESYHHHSTIERHMKYLRARCGRGFYIVLVIPEDDSMEEYND